MSASIEMVRAWVRRAVAILRHRHPLARLETRQLWTRLEAAEDINTLAEIASDAISDHKSQPQWRPGGEIGGDAIARATLSPYWVARRACVALTGIRLCTDPEWPPLEESSP